MYSTKQMQNTSAVSPSPAEFRAQHQGLPRACCCPSPSCLPAVLAAGALPSCQAAKPRSCPSHPPCALCTPVSSTPPLRGWCRAPRPWAGAAVWFGGCGVCVCTMCVHVHGGRGGSSGPPELPSDAVLVFGPTALCWVPCQNGGSCAFPGRCACPPGWMGRVCQTGTGHTAPLRAPCVGPAPLLPESFSREQQWGTGGPLPTDGPRGGGQGPWLLTKP